MISLCGPNEASPEELSTARRVGELIAGAGHALVCGGRGGVMQAAAEGAKLAGGVTIGILPEYDVSIANPFIDFPIPTGMGHGRNVIVVASGSAVIAIGGGFGTLSEIGLALKMGKRVIHIGSWELDANRLARFDENGAEYIQASTAEEAVELAIAQANVSQPGHG